MKTSTRKMVKRCIAGVICLALMMAVVPMASAERLIDRYAVLFEGEAASYNSLPSFGKVLAQWQNAGMSAATTDVSVPLIPSAVTGNQPTTITHEGKDGLLMEEGSTSVTFTVTIPADGLYELEVVYFPYEGNGQKIRRSIAIDGKVLFSEAENLCLYRHYRYIGEERYNGFGDQLPYAQEEVKGWYTSHFRDVDGKYATELRWGFKAGQHTITLNYVDQPLLLHSMTLKAPKQVEDYATVSSKYPTQNIPKIDPIKWQAEDPLAIIYRNESTVSSYGDNNPATYPAADGTKKINCFGGSAWNRGNQEISYRFTVPETGLYKLAMRVQQPWTNGMNAYRQILIDGELPFEEMREYPIEYSREWYTEVLSDENDQPYAFYLTEGEHIITVRAVMSVELTAAIEKVRNITDTISTLYRKILLITTASPDPNYDYDLDKAIPDMMDTFAKIQVELEETKALIMSTSQRQPASVSNLNMISQQIKEMQEDEDRIPGRLSDISNSMTTLGNMITTLQDTPLGIDEIVFYPTDAAVEKRVASFLETVVSAIKNFMLSFERDYTSVVVSNSNKDCTIDVWVTRGTEWANVMQRLIQSDFEQNNNIGVNLNVLPTGTLASTVNPLLLAITSGDGPDVVLNVEANTTVEYGVRGMALDLKSEFADYEQMVERFHPEIQKSFTFLDKVYAVPETMNFYVMAYRKDILNELGLKVPETWDEVHYQTLPILYQNGMEMTGASFDAYLYQYGGSYYTENGLDTALDSVAAHKAFDDNIAQFMDLGFPIIVNFFSRFRTGEMPIGYVDFAAYLQVLTAAPELAGKWDIAPIPGIKNEDGTINRATTGLTATADMILTAGKDRKDACWTFLKWWTDTETQTNYGLELESLLGASARLNTSNINAFRRLPWSKSTLATVEEYWKHAKAVPNVLGGVITGREISNASNSALYDGVTPREALEKSIILIRDELKRKQNLYNISAN